MLNFLEICMRVRCLQNPVQSLNFLVDVLRESDDWVQRVPHFMGNCGAYKLRKVFFLVNLLVQNLRANVLDLEHKVLFTIFQVWSYLYFDMLEQLVITWAFRLMWDFQNLLFAELQYSIFWGLHDFELVLSVFQTILSCVILPTPLELNIWRGLRPRFIICDHVNFVLEYLQLTLCLFQRGIWFWNVLILLNNVPETHTLFVLQEGVLRLTLLLNFILGLRT